MERALQGEHVPLSKAWGSHGPEGGSAAALVLCIRALPLMHGWLHHDVRCIMGTWVGLLSADFECLPDRHLHPNGTKSISKSFWRRYYFTDFRLVRLIPCRKKSPWSPFSPYCKGNTDYCTWCTKYFYTANQAYPQQLCFHVRATCALRGGELEFTKITCMHALHPTAKLLALTLFPDHRIFQVKRHLQRSIPLSSEWSIQGLNTQPWCY